MLRVTNQLEIVDLTYKRTCQFSNGLHWLEKSARHVRRIAGSRQKMAGKL